VRSSRARLSPQGAEVFYYAPAGTLRRVAALPAQVVVYAFRHQGTVRRLLTALVQCGLAHRAICPAEGILRSGPVKMECTHENIACKDCGATISP